jgi:biopolymer transport protein ExbB
MTAAGLAVAIPAVLAYNAFVRSNRVVLAQLDSFAHDLYAFLTTGSRVNDVASVVPLKTPPLAVRGAT